MGFAIALYGVSLVLAAAAATREALRHMKAGRPIPADRVVGWTEMAEIVGVPDYLAVDRRLARQRS
jgi:hypothetical protein